MIVRNSDEYWQLFINQEFNSQRKFTCKRDLERRDRDVWFSARDETETKTRKEFPRRDRDLRKTGLETVSRPRR